MSYQKNTAGQKVNFLAINTATGLPVTGDSSNVTAKISKDSAAAAALSDTNPTELDATNFPGIYVFDLTQAETNGDVLTIKASSTTANVELDVINIYTITLSATPLEIYNYFTVSGNEDAFKADVSALATASSISALNDFNPSSDVVANVTLVGTTTTNTDMRGTDSANTVVPANSDITAIKSKTDQFVFTVSNEVDANALTGGTSAADIYTYFTTGSNADAFKATSNLGSGAITFTLTVNDGSNPIEGVSVWITTDSEGSNVVAGASPTNSLGQVTFSLDAGTYYQFNQLGGYSFNNPTTITVS